MESTPYNELVVAFAEVHQQILKLAEGLPEGELAWRPGPMANTLGFYLWHIARWADYLPASLPETTPGLRQLLGPRQETGYRENLAARWQLNPEQLGDNESGMDMGGEKAAGLVLPDKDTLLAYAGQAFAALEQVLPLIDEAQFTMMRQQAWATQTLGHYLFDHLRHECEHLGMMMYIHGLYQSGRSAG
jgi:hypothetical protein